VLNTSQLIRDYSTLILLFSLLGMREPNTTLFQFCFPTWLKRVWHDLLHI
jgi:hypothetical protein